MKSLTGFVDLHYSKLPESVKSEFKNTKIRILQFSIVNEPSLSSDQEDKVKKEIFKRYNSGIIALKQQEIDRAAYINDPLVHALNIFVRNQRINARFSTKGNITNKLGEISRNNDPVFGDALKDVNSFIEKLKLLCGEDFENFNKMLGHTKKNTQSRTNQNFYLLWIAIAHIEFSRVQNQTEQILNNIRELFLISQDINDENFDTTDYVQKLSSI